MAHLSSCYFCGTAFDEPLQVYRVPHSEGDTTVTLCSTCHRKLDTILDAGDGAGYELERGVETPAPDEPELGRESTELTEDERVEPETPAGATDSGGVSSDLVDDGSEESDDKTADGTSAETGEETAPEALDEDGQGLDEVDRDLEEMSRDLQEIEETSGTFEDIEETDGDVEEMDEKIEIIDDFDGMDEEREEGSADIGGGTESVDDDGARGSDDGDEGEGLLESESGEAAADGIDDRDRTDESADPLSEPGGATDEADAADSGAQGGTDGKSKGDGDAGSARTTISALEYNKVMRLLQNREFPVERREIETIAANAYDLAERDCARVIDLAVDRGLLREEDGQLHRPES